MRVLTEAEAIAWCRAHGISLGERDRPLHSAPRSGSGTEFHTRRFQVPNPASKHLWFCRTVDRAIRPWNRCLLWVTEWGIWESSENWHLFYRLRQSYGDPRLIEEAPAHLFLDYEADDLVSFLQLGLAAGWDLHLLTRDDYGRAFISHDEWMELALVDETGLDSIAAALSGSAPHGA